MKTKNLLFMVGLIFLGGIIKGNGQTNIIIGAPADLQTNPGNAAENVIIGRNTNTTPNTTVGMGGNIVYKSIFIGPEAGANYQNTTSAEAARNVFIGYGAGAGIGSLSLTPIASGVDNVFIGTWAGRNSHTVTPGGSNVCLGANSGYGLQGSGNTFIGRSSGGSGNPIKDMTGNNNTFLGANTGLAITTGASNIAIGANCGNVNMTGQTNISIGTRGPVGGNSNILVGTDSGYYNTGNNNLLIGNISGKNLRTGINNTFLGRVNVPDIPETSLRYGNDTSGAVILATGSDWQSQRLYIAPNGYTGIGLAETGNNKPQNSLEIGTALGASVAGTSGLRFRNYLNTNYSTATPTTNRRVLTVNNVGDVILVDDVVGTGGASVFANGTNTTISGLGITGTPYQVNAKNIYSDDGTLAGNRTVDMDNYSMIFDTQTDGRIYIGNTATPVASAFVPANFATTTGNYRLYVEGGILTEKVKVALRSTSDWADYVFANDYKLMPLKEVAVFIEENKHLPGITSASELVKNGLDVAEMQSKQMGKIEELTLYVIQQSKEIEELKAQVKALLEKK